MTHPHLRTPYFWEEVIVDVLELGESPSPGEEVIIWIPDS